ncbi:transcriptional regulator, TetR family [Hydrocarboniphaga daqingensis]|uniref:Transcriptional regulator, TetR family n=1 Tax=Hydrocarboniphaga daqingensis TaxID=490188 RepID=A0A1M5KCG7_9GAMM|nr:TetR/AcrR family transcriptional regulator [Hydrocarboniphaga daqingensis]SHG50320.1 transcriptional regulator, TetR family [Hydrocarboniphaga daqingensis]
MPRKPAHEQFDTLSALQDRAFELFGRYGYEGVSIGDISKAARLSKGALYWHFAGKEELFLECLRRLHAIFTEHVIEPMRAQNDSMMAILAMFSGLEKLLRDPRVQNGVAGYWLVPSTPETQRLVAEQRAFEVASQATIRDVLAAGSRQGHFDLGEDLEDMSQAIISLMEAAILPLRHQEPDEVHSMTRVLARTLFRAYATPEALRTFAPLLQKGAALPA